MGKPLKLIVTEPQISSGEAEAVLKRALERERIARQRAEDVLETMSSKIFETNEKLRSQNEALEFITKIAEIAEEDGKMTAALEKFLDLSVRLLGWPLAHVYWASKENPDIFESSRIWAGPDLQACPDCESFRKVTEAKQFTVGEGLPGQVVAENHVVWIEDLTQETNFPRAKFLQSLRYKSAIGIPLALNGKVFAVFEFFHTSGMVKNLEKSKVIQTGAMQLARLLERKSAQKLVKKNYLKLQSAQQQLVQSEKMASLGIITAGVAHEINNPLSFILTNIDVLKGYWENISSYQAQMDAFIHKLPKEDREQIEALRKSTDYDLIRTDSPELIGETLSGVFRVRDIVQGLKTFSHIEQEKKKEFNLLNCIHTSTRLLANEIRYKCDVKLDLQPVPSLIGYEGQIVQVLANLLMNSIQAMSEVKRGNIWISTHLLDDGKICVSVKDDGTGIPPALLNQIFTPFFTTKPVGKGTGLGLSISYGIIKAHNGDIQVKSVPGEGTQFDLIFSNVATTDSAISSEGDFEW